MAKEWYHNIPRNGILCKCKYDKDSDQYRVDVITRYNDHPLSDYRFRNNDKYYADAIPLTYTEIVSMMYVENCDDWNSC